ncbi:MAG: coproporphyrinogen-III oxidase family protein, partial [Oscillospiraceae bacterium]
MSAGIYIHIPFCAHKCPYCDFYSVAYDDGLCSKYIAAIGRETEAFPPLSADTIYFGGGTPSLLRTEHIECMLNAVRSRFNIADGAEITLECNPATCDREKLRDLHSLGINRLSVGVQSTDDAVLQAAGRLHNGDQALRTLSDAALAGFDNVSADLMIALPQDDGRALDRSISDVTSTGAKHVSAYLLKLMPQTPFGEQAPDGLPDDDDQALLYEHCCNAL